MWNAVSGGGVDRTGGGGGSRGSIEKRANHVVVVVQSNRLVHETHYARVDVTLDRGLERARLGELEVDLGIVEHLLELNVRFVFLDRDVNVFEEFVGWLLNGRRASVRWTTTASDC